MMLPESTKKELFASAVRMSKRVGEEHLEYIYKNLIVAYKKDRKK